jgi:hypothetical protein
MTNKTMTVNKYNASGNGDYDKKIQGGNAALYLYD